MALLGSVGLGLDKATDPLPPPFEPGADSNLEGALTARNVDWDVTLINGQPPFDRLKAELLNDEILRTISPQTVKNENSQLSKNSEGSLSRVCFSPIPGSICIRSYKLVGRGVVQSPGSHV